MAKTNDWFPTRRTEQLAMAKTWSDVPGLKKTARNVPAADGTRYKLQEIILSLRLSR